MKVKKIVETGGTYTVCLMRAMTSQSTSSTITVTMPAAFPRLKTFLIMSLRHPFPRRRRPEDDFVLERKVQGVEEVAEDAGEDDRRVHRRQAVRLFHLGNVETDPAVAGDQFGRDGNDQRDGRADAEAGRDAGQRRRERHPPQRLVAGDAEIPGHVEGLRIDGLPAVDRVD